MRAGHTLLELLIYIAIVSISLSLIFPNFNTTIRQALLYEDVKSIKSVIRYARVFSYLKNCEVQVHFTSKRVTVNTLDNGVLKSYDLKIAKIRGDKLFAFSKGTPYIAGSIEFNVRNSVPVILTVTPVVGKINVKELK